MAKDPNINNELDKLIICPNCNTLHKKIDLPKGKSAKCRKCGVELYRNDGKILNHSLALGITGIILFILSNLFPLIKIEFFGHQQFVTIPIMIESMYEGGFYLVATIILLILIFIPMSILLLYIVFSILMLLRKGKALSKDLLIMLSKLLPWNMTEVFLLSILVAVTKLSSYVEINMGISFWSLAVFVLLDVYLIKHIHIGELWDLRYRVFHAKK